MNCNTKKLLDMTLKDLAKKKEDRQAGIREVDNFLNECKYRRRKIARNAKRRGDRSFG